MRSSVLAGGWTFAAALRASGAVAIVGLATALVVLEGRTLMVVLAGLLAALALRGTSQWVAAKARVPYGAALAALVVLVVAAMAVGLYFLGSGIARQADAFVEQVPQAWHSVLDAVQRRPALARLAPPMGKELPALADGASLVSGAGGVLEVASALVVVFFLGLYGAASPGAYARVVLLLVPPAHRDRADAILGDIGASLTHWLGGRAVAMAIVGSIVTVGLYALKIPLAGTLGALAGWLTFIEYLGAFVSAAPALLLAASRGSSFVLGVGALFAVAHVLEGYVLTPLLVRSTVRIPPGYTLSAQIVLGSVFGVVGLTFATPVTLIATLLVKHLYVEREGRGRRPAGAPTGRVPAAGRGHERCIEG